MHQNCQRNKGKKKEKGKAEREENKQLGKKTCVAQITLKLPLTPQAH